jgi:WD40 repeat protein
MRNRVVSGLVMTIHDLDLMTHGTVVLQHSNPSDWVLSISVSADAQLLSTGGLLDHAYIWGRGGALIHSFHPPESMDDYIQGIYETGFHPSLPFYAYVAADGTLRVANTGTWDVAITLGQQERNTLAFAFANRLAFLGFGEQSGHISVWDIQQNRETMTYASRPDPCVLSFSLDSQTLSIVSSDGCCELVSVRTGKLVKELLPAEEKLSFGVFSPHNCRFLAVSESGLISILEADAFQAVKVEQLPLTNICRCAVSPCTPSIATRSSDGTIMVWDYLDNSFVKIATPPSQISPICYSADGARLLIGGKDGCVRSVPLTVI